MDIMAQVKAWAKQTFWRKRDHVSASRGTPDAGLPVVLASDGKLAASIIGAILTGLGTIVTAGFNLTLGGHSTLNGTLSGGGTVATGGFTYTIPATLSAVGVTQRLDQTINAAANASLAPSVPTNSPQTFILVIWAWTTIGNYYDSSMWITSGTGGNYTCTKVGGSGANVVASISGTLIIISNVGASNARVVVDVVTVKA